MLLEKAEMRGAHKHETPIIIVIVILISRGKHVSRYRENRRRRTRLLYGIYIYIYTLAAETRRQNKPYLDSGSPLTETPFSHGAHPNCRRVESLSGCGPSPSRARPSMCVEALSPAPLCLSAFGQRCVDLARTSAGDRTGQSDGAVTRPPTRNRSLPETKKKKKKKREEERVGSSLRARGGMLRVCRTARTGIGWPAPGMIFSSRENRERQGNTLRDPPFVFFYSDPRVSAALNVNLLVSFAFGISLPSRRIGERDPN